jgi:Ala-tRNA(Pro) deacylase
MSMDCPGDESSDAVHHRVLAKLDKADVKYTLTHHRAVKTSEEAAALRGVSLDTGAKAMLVMHGKKGKEQYALVVISASLRIDSKKLRKALKTSRMKFADPVDCCKVTGCLPGAVPPFGSCFPAPCPTLMDESLTYLPDINFNCGLRTASVAMSLEDYVRLEVPTVLCVAKTEPGPTRTRVEEGPHVAVTTEGKEGSE